MISNVSPNPPIWTDEALALDAQKAVDGFVERRTAEPRITYGGHFKRRTKAVTKLFRLLAPLDPNSPDPKIIKRILLDEELFSSLRYLAGPPVSEDDLGVLVKKGVKGLTKTDMKSDAVAQDILKRICALADPYRFPWVETRRKPTRQEIETAMIATVALHASQTMQTERRGYGREVEAGIEKELVKIGFKKISAKNAKSLKVQYPPKGKILHPSHHPAFPYFMGECIVYGRKVDLFVALGNGRMIAVEAKDSSSTINSKKRLLNDTAAKAKHYAVEAGKNIISVALLSGVYKFDDLKEAQKAGLFLVWSHNTQPFIDWIKSQV